MKLLLMSSLIFSASLLANKASNELSCRQAYEKVRWKTQHKKPFHKTLTLWRARKFRDENGRQIFGKQTKRDDVQAAIDYGFKSGTYCQDGKILSQKQFQEKTVENMRAIKASGMSADKFTEATVKVEPKLNCQELIQSSRTRKEDGLTRRTAFLASDLHNIEQAYANQEAPENRKELRAKRKKDRFFRSIRRKAVKKYDDDSISMDQIHSAFDGAIADGSACSGRKVMNRAQMRRIMLDRLAHRDTPSKSINSSSSNITSEMRNIQVIFEQNGKKQDVKVQGQGV